MGRILKLYSRSNGNKIKTSYPLILRMKVERTRNRGHWGTTYVFLLSLSIVNTRGNNLLHDQRNWEKVMAVFKCLEESSLHLQFLFHPTTFSQSLTQVTWNQYHYVFSYGSCGERCSCFLRQMMGALSGAGEREQGEGTQGRGCWSNTGRKF